MGTFDSDPAKDSGDGVASTLRKYFGDVELAKNDGFAAATPDASPAQGWRKGAQGGWMPTAGIAAKLTQFGLKDDKYLTENKKYFEGGAGRTKYYDEDERDAHRVQGKDGLLCGAGNEKLDTHGAAVARAVGSGKDSHIFAADGSGLYSADSVAESEASGPPGPRREAIHHTSFLGGGKAESAGEIRVHDGWLKMVSNSSGHYKPGAQGNVQAVEALQAMGVNTDAALVHQTSDRGDDNQGHDFYNARAFAASRGNEKLLDSHKQMFRQIHKGARSQHDGTLDGMIARETVQRARGADAEPVAPRPLTDPRGYVHAIGSYRDRPGPDGPIVGGKVQMGSAVERDSVAAGDQAIGDGFRRGPDRALPTDVRGHELSSWRAGTYNAWERELKKRDDQELEAERLADALASEGPPPLRVPLITPSLPSKPVKELPPYDQGEQATSLASKPVKELPPYHEGEEAPAFASKPVKVLPKLDEDDEGEKARMPESKPVKSLLPDGITKEQWSANVAPIFAKKMAARAAARAAPSQSRADGAHLGKHDVRVDPSRIGELRGRWRKQEGALIPSTKEKPAVAWRHEKYSAEDAPIAPVSMPRDPRKTKAYEEEFTQYMPTMRDMSLPKEIGQRTKRYDEKELADHELRVGNGVETDPHGRQHAQSGLLQRADGTLLDTTGAAATILQGSDTGRNIFALTGHAVHSADGEGHGQTMHAADVFAEHARSRAAAVAANAKGEPAAVDRVHHSSFNGGQALEGAGDIKVKQGFVQRLSNQSGHYEPDQWTSNLQSLEALEKMGANLDATTVENRAKFGDDLKTETFQARALLAGGDRGKIDEKTIARLRGQKDVFSDIGGRRSDAGLVADFQPGGSRRPASRDHGADFAVPLGSFDSWQKDKAESLEARDHAAADSAAEARRKAQVALAAMFVD